MQRILILSASIGSGHVKAAEAVAIELRRLLPEAEITTVDFMARRISLFHALLKSIYLVMLRFVPNIYDIFYHVAGNSSGGGLVRSAFSYTMLPAFSRLLGRYKPDIVVCTHPFPEGAASLLQEKKPFFLAAVMTDYSLHQIWLSPHVDCYFMATEAMRQEMLEAGFPAEKLFADGIPIAGMPLGAEDKERVRRSLAIPVDQRVVLLMGGGLGIGGIEESLRALESIEERLTLLVVAGRNERLRERVLDFADSTHHHILVYGYTDRVRMLMSAADLLITKPGALTMSEAFTLGLPMLLHDPIPGPETDNAIYASHHGAAVWLHPGESIAQAVEAILSEKLPSMQRAARSCARPQAAREIASHILSAYSQNKFFLN